MSSDVFLFSLCIDDLSIGENGVLKSPTVTVLELIYVLKSSSILFMKFGAPEFDAYVLMIKMSFW